MDIYDKVKINPTDSMPCPQYVWYRMDIYDKVKINPTDSMRLSTVCMVPDEHLRQSQDKPN